MYRTCICALYVYIHIRIHASLFLHRASKLVKLLQSLVISNARKFSPQEIANTFFALGKFAEDKRKTRAKEERERARRERLAALSQLRSYSSSSAGTSDGDGDGDDDGDDNGNSDVDSTASKVGSAEEVKEKHSAENKKKSKVPAGLNDESSQHEAEDASTALLVTKLISVATTNITQFTPQGLSNMARSLIHLSAHTHQHWLQFVCEVLAGQVSEIAHECNAQVCRSIEVCCIYVCMYVCLIFVKYVGVFQLFV